MAQDTSGASGASLNSPLLKRLLISVEPLVLGVACCNGYSSGIGGFSVVVGF